MVKFGALFLYRFPKLINVGPWLNFDVRPSNSSRQISLLRTACFTTKLFVLEAHSIQKYLLRRISEIQSFNFECRLFAWGDCHFHYGGKKKYIWPVTDSNSQPSTPLSNFGYHRSHLYNPKDIDTGSNSKWDSDLCRFNYFFNRFW